VNYVVTRPGRYGELWAFVAEALIAFILMSVILWLSNTRALNRYTGLAAGALIMVYVSIEAPISGMSMNPARTLGSAVAAHVWTGIWIYFTAPPIGMLMPRNCMFASGGLIECFAQNFIMRTGRAVYFAATTAVPVVPFRLTGDSSDVGSGGVAVQPGHCS
jgi:hypothetical protein